MLVKDAKYLATIDSKKPHHVILLDTYRTIKEGL